MAVGVCVHLRRLANVYNFWLPKRATLKTENEFEILLVRVNVT